MISILSPSQNFLIIRVEIHTKIKPGESQILELCKQCGVEISPTQSQQFHALCPACVRLQALQNTMARLELTIKAFLYVSIAAGFAGLAFCTPPLNLIPVSWGWILFVMAGIFLGVYLVYFLGEKKPSTCGLVKRLLLVKDSGLRVLNDFLRSSTLFFPSASQVGNFFPSRVNRSFIIILPLRVRDFLSFFKPRPGARVAVTHDTTSHHILSTYAVRVI